MAPRTFAAFARRVIETTVLDEKLEPPERGLVDEDRGPAQFIDAPGRPDELAIVAGRLARVPPLEGMADPAQRVRILHADANHELQAVELFAWALLAFPDAPTEFRRGCLEILGDEQRHCAMYVARTAVLGAPFGAFPVSGHFWNRMRPVRTPLAFVCAMGLTFESANLDFALEQAAAARAVGDEATARVIEAVRRDEVRHVAFGWRWFERLRPEGGDAWETYRANLAAPLSPARARGVTFDREGREAAELSAAFIDRLAAERPEAPGGARR